MCYGVLVPMIKKKYQCSLKLYEVIGKNKLIYHLKNINYPDPQFELVFVHKKDKVHKNQTPENTIFCQKYVTIKRRNINFQK